MKKMIKIASASIMASLAIFQITAAAVTTNVSTPILGFASLDNLLTAIKNIVTGLAGAIAFILLLVGGIRYMTSSSEEATTGAKSSIVNAVIGLVIIGAAYALSTYLISALKL